MPIFASILSISVTRVKSADTLFTDFSCSSFVTVKQPYAMHYYSAGNFIGSVNI